MMYESDVARVTISIDAKTLRDIQRIAGKRGVSKFFVEAAKKKLGWAVWDEWYAERIEKYGPPPAKLVREVDRDMRKIFGLPPPPRPRRK